MPIDYDHFAEAYDRHRRGDTLHLATILELAGAGAVQNALELGAGTGKNTAMLHKTHPCRITALDLSGGMLEKAKRASIPAALIQAGATCLPFRANSFDFLYSTYLLHHIEDLRALFSEAWRVLAHGAMATLTVPEDWIQAHPMAAYFPSFPRIDLARFQRVEDVEKVMRAAGFQQVSHQVHTGPPEIVDHAYVARVEAKFVSTFALLAQEEFDEGLTRLKADVRASGRLSEPFRRQTVTIWGYK